MNDRTPNGLPPIHYDVSAGHVHLGEADLSCALAFYRDGLGFAVTGRLDASAAFLAAIGDGLAAHVARPSRDVSPRRAGGTGDRAGDPVNRDDAAGDGVELARDRDPAEGSGDERNATAAARERHETDRLAAEHEPAAATARRVTRADRARWFEHLAR